MTTKEELLFALEKASMRGETLSGEELALRIGVSRVSVWKAAKQLSDEGLPISPVKGKGYVLDPSCRKISEGRIRAHLPPELSDAPVFVYEKTDSTNTRAKSYAEGKTGVRAIFVSDEQTCGKGRLGRRFYSPPGTGLYFSYLFSSRLPLETLGAVTPFAAVAVSSVLEEFTGRKVGIKWVNDLYADHKKICGILAEAVASLEGSDENKIVVGVGINLDTTDFPEELKEKAGSLHCLVNRSALAAAIAEKLGAFEKDPFDRSFMKEYTERSIVLGREVVLDKWGETVTGRVVGFDSGGGLLLDVGEKSPRLYTGGEISLRVL